MRLRSALKGVSAICAVSAVILLPLSCNKDDGGDGAAESEESKVEATGVLAVFPQGALPLGAKAEIVEGEVPTEFAALAEAPAASKAYDVTAETKDGEPIAEALKPFTLSIELSEPATSLLGTQDKSVDNLCVVMKYDSKLYVWRKGGFTVLEGNAKIDVTTSRFGLYQMIYCGSLAMDGFELVAGTAVVEEEPGATGEAVVCDARTSTDAPGFCYEYPSFIKDDADDLASTQEACDIYQGTLTTNSACPSEERSGECRWSATVQSVEVKYAKSYYSAHHTTEEALADCTTLAASNAVYTYKFFDADGTEQAIVVPEPDVFPLYCDIPADYTCHQVNGLPSGTYFSDYCSGLSGTAVAACLPTNFSASCTVGDIKFNYYTGTSDPLNDFSGCTAAAGAWDDTPPANPSP